MDVKVRLDNRNHLGGDMFKVRFFIFIVTLFTFSLSHGNSKPYVDSCKNSERAPSSASYDEGLQWSMGIGRCIGVIEGVSGALQLVDKIDADGGKLCLPPSWTYEDGRQAVFRYANGNPENLKMKPPIFVMLALISAYGCWPST